MSRLLRPFGHGGSTVDWGFTLPLLLGHLEGLASDEEQNCGSRGPKAKRLELVQDAIDKLNQAMEMGDEDR